MRFVAHQTQFTPTCTGSRAPSFLLPRKRHQASLIRSPPSSHAHTSKISRTHGGRLRRNSSSSSSSSSTSIPATRKRWLELLEEFLRKPRIIPIPRWITPRQKIITLSECFGHGSFILVFVSYAVDDYLWLRILAVAGSSAMLLFTYFHPHGRILWLPFQWNVLFIATNLYRIGKVHLDGWRADQIGLELIQFRNRNFYLMQPSDFARLIQRGSVRHFDTDHVIIRQGEDNASVGLVISGTAKVYVDGKLTYMLSEANFMHESGLHVGLLLPGNMESCCTVVAETECQVLLWDRTDLVSLMLQHGSIRRSLKAILSWDIVRKLKQQRHLLTTHTIGVEDVDNWTERRNQQTHYRYRAILKNMCHHPHTLREKRKQLLKYRMIHNIDDAEHVQALKEIGWTVQEFEAGYKEGASAEHDELSWCQRLLIKLGGSANDFE